MRMQILRNQRPRPPGEIGGRGDGGTAHRRPDPHRDHVLLQALAQADAGIETALDDIGEPVVDDEIELDLGIARNEVVERAQALRFRRSGEP